MRPIAPLEARPVENIYNFLKLKDETVNKYGFIDELSNRGILTDDPRISKVISQVMLLNNRFAECLGKHKCGFWDFDSLFFVHSIFSFSMQSF